MESPEANLATLPFAVVGASETISLWSSGLRDGHAHADACVAYMVEHEAPPLLGQIAKAQISLGVYGRVEIEFWQRIAEHAASGVSSV